MGRSTRNRQPGERRYPHIERAANAVKQQHNAWVLEAAIRNGGDVVALDGVDLNTCGILVRGGVAAARIHVPNRPDFDAIVSRQSAGPAGTIYRATAQEFCEAYAALAPPRPPVRTVWLDVNARWGLHVERAVRALARCGCVADLFLTLSRGYHAPQLPAVLEAVEAIFGEEAPDAALTLVDEHTGEYGTGMMILHWRVAEGWWWERAWAARSASAPLAERLAAEGPKAFRKPRNVRAARG
jgi:hypothetical protein